MNQNYQVVSAPKEYPGRKYNKGRYCYGHQLAWWMHTGRVPKDGEIVHHKNKDKKDNRFENLQLMTELEHREHHASDRQTRMTIIVCAQCGKSKEREWRQVTTKIKNGQTDFYCDRSCMAKHFGAGRPKIIHG